MTNEYQDTLSRKGLLHCSVKRERMAMKARDTRGAQFPCLAHLGQGRGRKIKKEVTEIKSVLDGSGGRLLIRVKWVAEINEPWILSESRGNPCEERKKTSIKHWRLDIVFTLYENTWRVTLYEKTWRVTLYEKTWRGASEGNREAAVHQETCRTM